MKKYGYKFLRQEAKLGFVQQKKIEDAEKEWNELGQQGWKFRKEGNGVIIFMREFIGK